MCMLDIWVMISIVAFRYVTQSLNSAGNGILKERELERPIFIKVQTFI